jgi:hypothetical protein
MNFRGRMHCWWIFDFEIDYRADYALSPVYRESLSSPCTPSLLGAFLFFSFLICFSTSSAVIYVSSGAVYFLFMRVPASPSSFLPSSSFMKYPSHSCIVFSSLTDSFSSLSVYLFPYLPLCSYFIYLFLVLLPSLLLLFASRKLLLSILFLLHFLNAFTASFFSCSHSLAHHPLSFLLLLIPLLSPPFSSSLFRLLLSALPPSSPRPAPQILLFLVSSCIFPLFVHAILSLSPSSVPPLLLLSPFFVVSSFYNYFQREMVRFSVPCFFVHYSVIVSPCLLIFFFHSPSPLPYFLLLFLILFIIT